MWLFHSSLASHVDRETYIREKYVTDAAEDIVPTSKRNVQHSRKAWLVLYLEPPNHPSQVLTQKALNTHTLVTSYHPSSHSSGLPSVRSTWCRIICFFGSFYLATQSVSPWQRAHRDTTIEIIFLPASGAENRPFHCSKLGV
jgi:hypothetical protein